MASLRRGFTGEAESQAEEIRAELRVGNIKAIDPWQLAEHLAIKVWSLDALARRAGDHTDLTGALAVLYGPEQSSLSAVTVFHGTRRVIVYNERHDTARQASDICHEIAHGLLWHEPAPAFDEMGCRAWDSAMETEAAYLGGALLIPGKGARWAAKCGLTVEEVATRFACSVQMASWRDNASGAYRLRR